MRSYQSYQLARTVACDDIKHLRVPLLSFVLGRPVALRSVQRLDAKAFLLQVHAHCTMVLLFTRSHGVKMVFIVGSKQQSEACNEHAGQRARERCYMSGGAGEVVGHAREASATDRPEHEKLE